MESTTISGVSCVEIVRRVSSKMTGYYVYFNLAQAYYTTMGKATIQSDITSIVRHPKIQVWANLNDFLKLVSFIPLYYICPVSSWVNTRFWYWEGQCLTCYERVQRIQGVFCDNFGY